MNNHILRNRWLTLSTIFFLVLNFSVNLGALSRVEAVPSWLGTWRYRIPLTIDSGDIDAPLTNFTVLLHISNSSGITDVDVTHIFTILSSNYLKIALTTDDGTTQCYVEVEKWNNAGNTADLWSKIPSASNTSDTLLYFYYDIAQANNTAYVGLPNSVVAAQVWDSSFVFVSHMLDDPDTSHIRDSTSNNNDGTKLAANQSIVTTSGKISDAQNFDMIDDKISLTDSASLRNAGNNQATLNFWANFSAFTAVANREILGSWGHAGNRFIIYAAGAGDGLYVFVQTSLGFVEHVMLSKAALLGVWHQVTISYDGSNVYSFVDAVASHAALPLTGNFANVAVSWGFCNSFPGFSGILDEPRFSTIGRSAAWVLADYESSRDHLTTWGTVVTNYCYLTVYFQNGITLLVNSTSKANSTEIEFVKGTNANLTSNLFDSYTFFKYTYNTTSTLTNPLSFTLNGNTTIWAYSILTGGIDSLSFILAIVGITIAIVAFVGFSKRN